MTNEPIDACAKAIFATLCPGVRILDEDLPYYREAARACFKAWLVHPFTEELIAKQIAPKAWKTRGNDDGEAFGINNSLRQARAIMIAVIHAITKQEKR